jgi:aminopeptidase N
MKFLISFILSLSFFFLHAQDPYPVDRNLDIQHYEFHLEIADDTDELKGKAIIQLRYLDETKNAFAIDLVNKNAEGKGMSISSIKDKKSGRNLDFEHINNRVIINTSTGPSHEIEITYQGIPQNGLIISQNKYGERTFFGDNWPNRAHHWLPVVDHPSDKASCAFIVTAPNHYQVIGTGAFVESTDIDDATRRTHWQTDVDIATKVMVMGAARFAIKTEEIIDGVAVQSWVYPQDREKGFYDYALATQSLQFFNYYVGPYSYEKLANVQSKTRYGGMENASNIFYTESSVTGDRAAESLIAHEVAHQWFGNSVSEKDWYHIWLSEGFATYFTQLYFEHYYGREKLAEGMQQARFTVVKHWEGTKTSPVLDTLITDLNRLLSPNSYQKGAWVLHMLRKEIGDTNFRNGIRAYYAQYQNKNALSDDFRKVMEEVSGEDLSWFFEQWLRQPGHPIIEATWEYNTNAKAAIIDFSQTQNGHVFRFPIDIAVYTEGNNLPQIYTIEIDEKTTQIPLPSDQAPSHISLDPGTWLLFQGNVERKK